MIQNIKKSYFNPTQAFTLASRCMALLPESISTELALVDSVSTLESNIANLNNSLSRSNKSDYTTRLMAVDEVCDNAVKFLSANAQSYAYSHVKEKQEAGSLLASVIKQHIPRVSELGYVSEMAKIKALHTELLEPKYVKATKTLHLTNDVDHLIASRDAFEALYMEKNMAEKDKKEILTTKEASEAVLVSLQSIINKLNAHLLLKPSDTLSELASSFNSVLTSVTKASK